MGEFHVGVYLRELRRASGYTRRAVADILGVDAAQVEAWESGREFPKLYLPRLFALYHILPDGRELKFFEEEKELSRKETFTRIADRYRQVMFTGAVVAFAFLFLAAFFYIFFEFIFQASAAAFAVGVSVGTLSLVFGFCFYFSLRFFIGDCAVPDGYRKTLQRRLFLSFYSHFSLCLIFLGACSCCTVLSLKGVAPLYLIAACVAAAAIIAAALYPVGLYARGLFADEGEGARKRFCYRAALIGKTAVCVMLAECCLLVGAKVVSDRFSSEELKSFLQQEELVAYLEESELWDQPHIFFGKYASPDYEAGGVYTVKCLFPEGTEEDFAAYDYTVSPAGIIVSVKKCEVSLAADGLSDPLDCYVLNEEVQKAYLTFSYSEAEGYCVLVQDKAATDKTRYCLIAIACAAFLTAVGGFVFYARRLKKYTAAEEKNP